MYYIPENIGKANIAAVLTIGELEVIEAKQVKDGSMDIMDMNRMVFRIHTQVVGPPIAQTAFEAATGHP